MQLTLLQEAIARYNPRLLIFDLDGTLYNLKKMQLFMSLYLITFYLLRPWRWRELFILLRYRHWRNGLTDSNFSTDDELYQSFAKTNGLNLEELQCLVETWLLNKPLRLLTYCRYPELQKLFAWCRSSGLELAVFSDYPPTEKLDLLAYRFDYTLYTLNSGGLKPSPASLLLIAQHFALDQSQCLVIGDMDAKDGLAAASAGMNFINIRNY